MTTAEPPTPAVEPEGEYNLAARIYGDAATNERRAEAPTRDAEANGNGTDSNGADENGVERPYNLADRVYGNGDAPNGGSRRTNGNGRAARYNLAARVYGAPSDPNDNAAAVAVAGNGVATATAVAAPPARGAPPVAAPAVEGGGGAKARMLTSFKVRAFRWYFIAQFGTWGAMNMQMVVNGYLVFTLTGSFAALGITALARSAPGIVLSLVGGVLADRMPKKYLIQFGQALSALVALWVAFMLLFDQLRFEHLLISSFLQGSMMSMMMPARQAMLPGLVGMSRIQNAQALGMGVMNVMRMAGPAAGGLMLAFTGAEWVYFAMAAMYAFAVVAYFRVPHVENTEPPPPEPGWVEPERGASMGRGTIRQVKRGSLFADMIDGFKYSVREPVIGTLLLVNLMIVLVSMPYQMMLPGYVIEVLGGGPGTLGMLQSIAGSGAVAAIVVIAAMPTHHRGKVMLAGAFVMGVALLGFSFSTALIITAPIMVVISIGQTFRMSLNSVLLQTYVDDNYRGRVMSVFMMEMGFVSLSTFIAGMLASVFGPQVAIGGMAVILLIITVFVWIFVPRLRKLD
jgi:MFS family permease